MGPARLKIVAASATAANVRRRPRLKHIDDAVGANLRIAGRSWQIVASPVIGNYELVFAAAYL